jgi:hypothetical protein
MDTMFSRFGRCVGLKAKGLRHFAEIVLVDDARCGQ